MHTADLLWGKPIKRLEREFSLQAGRRGIGVCRQRGWERSSKSLLHTGSSSEPVAWAGPAHAGTTPSTPPCHCCVACRAEVETGASCAQPSPGTRISYRALLEPGSILWPRPSLPGGSEAVLSPCTHGRTAASGVSSAGAARALCVWRRGLPGAALGSPGASAPTQTLHPGQAGSQLHQQSPGLGAALPAKVSVSGLNYAALQPSVSGKSIAFPFQAASRLEARCRESQSHHALPLPSRVPRAALPVPARVPPEVTSAGERILAQTLARHFYFCAERQPCRVTYLGCSPAPSQPRYLVEVYCIC